uniref:Uncharacterized protein n=1 Tax=Anguilla anguilla TaxID=7936 RepID=A0A0E9UTU5_ANGAN
MTATFFKSNFLQKRSIIRCISSQLDNVQVG